MNKSISVLANLLLSSTVPASEAGYCHMEFPPMREESLSWKQPVFDDSSAAIIDFYGSCDHDPLGNEERRSSGV
jgi:hypothetical protein